MVKFLKLAEAFVDGADFHAVLVELELVVGHEVVFYESFADLALNYL